MITKYHFNLTRFYRNARELSAYESKTNTRIPKNKHKTKYELENKHKPG